MPSLLMRKEFWVLCPNMMKKKYCKEDVNMKLNELYSKTLKEVVEELELADVKVHPDEEGNIRAVELKYVEKKESTQSKTKDNPWA